MVTQKFNTNLTSFFSDRKENETTLASLRDEVVSLRDEHLLSTKEVINILQEMMDSKEFKDFEKNLYPLSERRMLYSVGQKLIQLASIELDQREAITERYLIDQAKQTARETRQEQKEEQKQEVPALMITKVCCK